MGSAMITAGDALADSVEQAVIGGDLSRLKPEERVNYYRAVCNSLGLNPLTKPFAYINLNGKLTLYALKDCTEQLRAIHRVSLTIVNREVIDGVYVVTTHASRHDGRSDESTGAVSVEGLKGEAKANAMMKAETKSKRRVTLSVCGLGMLDESEVETIPAEPIDTGGHPMNTREAQQYVADKQIAEIKARREQRDITPTTQPTEAATVVPQIPAVIAVTAGARPKETISVPDPVQEIYARMGAKAASITSTLADLKFELSELIGNEAAINKSNDLYVRFGPPTKSVGNARSIALGLWTEIQAAKKNQEDAALHGHKSATEPDQAVLIPQEVGYGPE